MAFNWNELDRDDILYWLIPHVWLDDLTVATTVPLAVTG